MQCGRPCARQPPYFAKILFISRFLWYNPCVQPLNSFRRSAAGLWQGKDVKMEESKKNNQSTQRLDGPGGKQPGKQADRRKVTRIFIVSFCVCLIAAAIVGGIWYVLSGGMPGYGRSMKLGAQAMEAGDYARAEEYFVKALELDGQSVEARLNLIAACEKQEKFERMLVLAKEGVELSPATYEYYECAVRAFVHMDRMDEARAFINGVENNYAKIKIERNRPEPVSFSAEPGTYGEEFSLRLSASVGCSIYYTTDGGVPTIHSTQYTDPIPLTYGTTVVRAFAVSHSGIITDEYSATYVLRDENAPYTFKDAKVEQLVRRILGLAYDDITYKQLDKITAFTNTPDGGEIDGSILTIADFKEFINLDEVRLTGEREIADLEVLAELPGLSFLTLNQCDVSNEDLQMISQLAALTSLSLDDNVFTDLTPLGALTGLTYLSVSDNGLRDVAGLASLSKLKTLVAADNQIIDPQGVAGIVSVSVLDLSGNQLSSVVNLAPLTRLTDLNLSGNRISSLDGISAFPSLRNLDLSANSLTDIAPLSALRNLDALDLSRNRVSDYAPLAQTKLTSLKATHNSIGDLDSIASIRTLRTLNVATNMITSVKPLENLSELAELDVSNNLIFRLSPLTDCPSLGTVACGGNPAIDTRKLEERGITLK